MGSGGSFRCLGLAWSMRRGIGEELHLSWFGALAMLQKFACIVCYYIVYALYHPFLFKFSLYDPLPKPRRPCYGQQPFWPGDSKPLRWKRARPISSCVVQGPEE